MSGKSTNDHDTASHTLNQMDTNMDPASNAESNPRESELITNYGNLSGYLPGFNFIRNSVIKPLLFATEKVVESYIGPTPNEQPQLTTQ